MALVRWKHDKRSENWKQLDEMNQMNGMEKKYDWSDTNPMVRPTKEANKKAPSNFINFWEMPEITPTQKPNFFLFLFSLSCKWYCTALDKMYNGNNSNQIRIGEKAKRWNFGSHGKMTWTNIILYGLVAKVTHAVYIHQTSYIMHSLRCVWFGWTNIAQNFHLFWKKILWNSDQ